MTPVTTDEANEADPDVDKPIAGPEEPTLQQEPEPEPQPTQPAVVTLSGRTSRPPRRLIAAVGLFLHTFSPLPTTAVVLELLQSDVEAYSEPHPLALFSEHMVAFIGSNPHTMTLDEALKEPDRDQFVEAMRKELQDHVERWKVIPRKAVPNHKIPIPMVWSMKRKRNPVGNIVKWKARLCAGDLFRTWTIGTRIVQSSRGIQCEC
jgi:hypothetical protein